MDSYWNWTRGNKVKWSRYLEKQLPAGYEFCVVTVVTNFRLHVIIFMLGVYLQRPYCRCQACINPNFYPRPDCY
jgi:hypothetical protein